MRRNSLLSLAVLICAWSWPAAAQEPAAPQIAFVYSEHVRASMTEEYEAMTKEYIDLMISMPEATEGVRFTTVMGPEIGYAFVSFTDDFSGIDRMYQSWETLMGAAGEKLMELASKAGAAVDHAESFLLMLRPDLSYQVEAAALKPMSDTPLRMYHWWYGIPGQEAKLEAVAKDFAQLYKSKGVERGWLIYQAITGPDLPMYLVVETAKDEVDYHTAVRAVQEQLGEEGKELSGKAMKVTRRMDINHGWVRPDLSFPPAKPKSGEY